MSVFDRYFRFCAKREIFSVKERENEGTGRRGRWTIGIRRAVGGTGSEEDVGRVIGLLAGRSLVVAGRVYRRVRGLHFVFAGGPSSVLAVSE